MPESGKFYRGKILIVEDDPHLAAVLKEIFVERGYEVMATASVLEAKRLVDGFPFDLVILDLVLKDGEGLEVCRHVRAHALRAATPVIVFTAKADVADKAKGVAEGADYYLVKPMPVEELLLWVRAMLKRVSQDWSRGTTIGVHGLRLDPETRVVIAAGEVVRGLTAREFAVLYELARALPGHLSREELLARVWGKQTLTNTLEVHVQRLRRKLGPQGGAHLVTVRGTGYRLE